MSQMLTIPTLLSCRSVEAYREENFEVLTMVFATEDERQDYSVVVRVDPMLVLHGPSAVRALFDQQREALPEESRAAWDDAVSKIEVAA